MQLPDNLTNWTRRLVQNYGYDKAKWMLQQKGHNNQPDFKVADNLLQISVFLLISVLFLNKFQLIIAYDIITLDVGMYFVAPSLVIMRLRRHKRFMLNIETKSNIILKIMLVLTPYESAFYYI